MVSFNIDMPVPALLVFHAATIDLHEANAPLHQPAGEQALLPEMRALLVLQPIKFTRGCRLLVQVERLGRRHLHAISHLEALDARGKFRFVWVFASMATIELLHQVKLRPWIFRQTSNQF